MVIASAPVLHHRPQQGKQMHKASQQLKNMGLPPFLKKEGAPLRQGEGGTFIRKYDIGLRVLAFMEYSLRTVHLGNQKLTGTNAFCDTPSSQGAQH